MFRFIEINMPTVVFTLLNTSLFIIISVVIIGLLTLAVAVLLRLSQKKK